MIFYIIPLLFIDIFLIFAAFRGFILSTLEESRLYRILGMMAVGLYAFISCEVLLDIMEYYYPLQMIETLSKDPLYATIVSCLTMPLVYIYGREWVASYLVSLEEQ